jgi:hypothetical protein
MDWWMFLSRSGRLSARGGSKAKQSKAKQSKVEPQSKAKGIHHIEKPLADNTKAWLSSGQGSAPIAHLGGVQLAAPRDFG